MIEFELPVPAGGSELGAIIIDEPVDIAGEFTPAVAGLRFSAAST